MQENGWCRKSKMCMNLYLLSIELWGLATSSYPPKHKAQLKTLMSKNRKSCREMTCMLLFGSFMSRVACNATISTTASCSLHHSYCSNYGHAMWRADGMAQHQAFLACTSSKIKKGCYKTEGLASAATFSKTNNRPQAFFTSDKVTPQCYLV